MPKSMTYIKGYMGKWLFFATIIGIAGGLSALALNTGITWISAIGEKFPIFLAPVMGGVLVMFIFQIDDQILGSGTNKYILSVNLYQGKLKSRTWVSKLLASAATIGFRGSGGVEGPMLLMGGSIANTLTKLPYMNRWIDKEDHRILTVCGAAGAIGAIFRSPLGGGVFAAELLYRTSLHYHDVFPAILSSTMGFVIYSTLGNTEPIFSIPAYIPNPSNVLYFVLAGVLAGYASLLFKILFHQVEKMGNYLEQKVSRKYLPILGGVLTGTVLMFFPDAGGTGSGFIQALIDGSFATQFLFFLLTAKILATAFTVGLGGSAGLVIPALFIGAVTGGILGNFFAVEGSGLASSLVISGMAASLASIANVPIAASVMLIEMVGFQVGVPAVIGSVLGYIVGQRKIVYGTMRSQDPNFRTGKDFRKVDRYFEE
ncbi:chloride channel protein [Isachenkonia alkalipeptolytica]|uniref:Chloride channel protein n=1 Tax=Isachenkonia alkalipeptolytica TaxID=2565777 RepID=A0AA44BCV4_9CLOT|nr:chloride channel protein [Isachenkonia alkalipeptolytica]NBG87402.1 chloride channel protein [Isachenkonia alkalipeptolytica]